MKSQCRMFGLVSVISKDVVRPVTQAKYQDKIQGILSVSSEHDCRKVVIAQELASFFKYLTVECYKCNALFPVLPTHRAWIP